MNFEDTPKNQEYLKQVWHLFADIKDTDKRMLYGDTFACFCFIHAIGQERAAMKLLKTLFKEMGEDNRRGLFHFITKSVSAGYEREVAESTYMHRELSDLFDYVEELKKEKGE